MPSGSTVASIALALALASSAGAFPVELDDAERARIGADMQGRVPDLLQTYQTWDYLHKEGRGNSEATTSGGLGWGEASFLRDYVYCYRVSRDTYWLDKIIDHRDRMVGSMTGNPEGFLAWADVDYSVNVVRVAAVGDVGQATIEPALQRPSVTRGQPTVTGHEYELRFPETDRYVLWDVTTGTEVAAGPYADELVLEALPPAKLTVRGPVKPDAVFPIHTIAPEPCEYQVHDGMVTYRIAQFIEDVLGDAALAPEYGEKARQYLALIDRSFLAKWESTWTEVDGGAGLYRFSANPTQRFPEGSLPHNQYLALARTWLVLADLPEYGNAALCRRRATAMATYFKRNLQPNGEAYVWNYWDPIPGEDIRRHIEDYSHATIDIGFAIEATRRGVVFDDQDLRRFSATYLDVMWNKDRSKPRFGKAVNTNEGDVVAGSDWLELALGDPEVWDVAISLCRSDNWPVQSIPTMLYVYQQLVGVTDEDRRECRRRTAELAALGGAVPNAGFELGSGDGVFGWTLASWAPEQGESTLGRIAGGHSGRHAISLEGRGDKVNLVAQASRALAVEGKRAVVLSVWYRTEGSPGAHVSVLGFDKDGRRVQYDSSGPFEPSGQWRQARHQFDLEPGVATAQVILRNGARGVVVYDDVSVEFAP